MAESHSSCRGKTQKPLTELEVAVAQQLMQLSDEHSSSNKRCRREEVNDDGQEVDQSLSDVTSAKIREIFGNEEEEEEEATKILRPKKQRRYRSLVNIYKATRPVSFAQP